MKRLNWIRCCMASLAAAALLAGCSNIRKIAKADPAADVHLPKKYTKNIETPPPAPDTTSLITFKKADGSEASYQIVMRERDAQTGEEIMAMEIEAVTISGSTIRNIVERNGKIVLDFVVSVPKKLLASDCQLILDPLMQRIGDTIPPTPEVFDPLVYRGEQYGRMQETEYGQYDFVRGKYHTFLRQYVYETDNDAAGHVTYLSDPNDKFDHLTDYLTPRYRYDEGIDVLPGGEIYTRIDGEYPDPEDRAREAWLRSLKKNRHRRTIEIKTADREKIRTMASQRLVWTGAHRDKAQRLLYETDPAVVAANLNAGRRYVVAEHASDSARRITTARPVPVNASPTFLQVVKHPYIADARLDTVVVRPDRVDFYYTEEVQADENSSKLLLYLAGAVEDCDGRYYDLRMSDTLTYNVASMADFVDTRTRYMQRIITRDAEANARFFFTFPIGKSALIDTLAENRAQIRAVRDLTRGLMTDPVYIIDSITLRATSSPEGTWAVNDRLARERAEALSRVLTTEFRSLYDSLKISASISIDESGHEVIVKGDDEKLPDLPNLLRTKHLAEDWEALRRMIETDTAIVDRPGILATIAEIADPDVREYRIRAKFRNDYEYIRKTLYPKMRAVDFRFNLHRRGMKQDTVYTTEVDTAYMRAVELLKKRRYESALEILRPYEDKNTALAYMSLGYNAAAYRILRNSPEAGTAENQYILAILASRMGDEKTAVQYYLHAAEMSTRLKFRGNRDPEISRLIQKYGLDREDFQ